MQITVQIFEDQKALGEVVVRDSAAETEQDAVDTIFKCVRIDRRYRFLGAHGFILPTDTTAAYLLYNGGRA
jgi:hypothetical protein